VHGAPFTFYDRLVSDADVLILGAGIIGCAVGYELARRGARVRIFDSRSVAAGATRASAGVLAPYIEAHERGPFFDLTIRSLNLYDNWIEQIRADSGVAIEYRRCGTLEIAMDDAAAERMRRYASGDEPIAWLDADAAREKEPALPESTRGALEVKIHGYVAVPSLTEALAWAALRHGAEIEANRRIVRIDPEGDELRVTAEDESTWSGTTVVVAAGSWSGSLHHGSRAVEGVHPIRGQLLRLRWSQDPLGHILWGPDCYVVPWTDGTVLVGATVEDVGFDERTTAAGVRDLLDAVCELLPGAWGATFLEARAGLRPATADGLPIIGRSTAVPGIVYATGHYRNGILLAPLTAALVADCVLGDAADPALAILQPSRPDAG
jgi:glycine oxidase